MLVMVINGDGRAWVHMCRPTNIVCKSQTHVPAYVTSTAKQIYTCACSYTHTNLPTLSRTEPLKLGRFSVADGVMWFVWWLVVVHCWDTQQSEWCSLSDKGGVDAYVCRRETLCERDQLCTRGADMSFMYAGIGTNLWREVKQYKVSTVLGVRRCTDAKCVRIKK